MEATTRHRILVVDDHPVMREALQTILEFEDDLEICGLVEGCRAARELLATVLPDLAIVDLSLGDCEGIDLVRELHAGHPDLAILVLSMHEESQYAERVWRAGARGYLMKEAASDQLVPAVRRLLDGQAYFSPATAARLGLAELEPPGS